MRERRRWIGKGLKEGKSEHHVGETVKPLRRGRGEVEVVDLPSMRWEGSFLIRG
jgi:hypothetical protein